MFPLIILAMKSFEGNSTEISVVSNFAIIPVRLPGTQAKKKNLN